MLKGARTVIAAPDGGAARAPFENPALATGGTGDVLSGTIGALLAQGLDPYAAARLGAYLHGVAGEVLRERLGDAGLLASDLPAEVARARHRLARVRDRGAGSARRAGVRHAGRHERERPRRADRVAAGCRGTAAAAALRMARDRHGRPSPRTSAVLRALLDPACAWRPS